MPIKAVGVTLQQSPMAFIYRADAARPTKIADIKGSRIAITAGDRTGLLYGIARVFSKYHVDLHTAKIVTLGERAEDTFFVRGDLNPDKQALLEQDLLATLRSAP